MTKCMYVFCIKFAIIRRKSVSEYDQLSNVTLNIWNHQFSIYAIYGTFFFKIFFVLVQKVQKLRLVIKMQ